MRTQYVDSVSLSDIARVLVALWLFGCLQLRNTTTPTRASRRIDAKRQKNQAVRSVLQVAPASSILRRYRAAAAAISGGRVPIRARSTARGIGIVRSPATPALVPTHDTGPC